MPSYITENTLEMEVAAELDSLSADELQELSQWYAAEDE